MQRQGKKNDKLIKSARGFVFSRNHRFPESEQLPNCRIRLKPHFSSAIENRCLTMPQSGRARDMITI